MTLNQRALLSLLAIWLLSQMIIVAAGVMKGELSPLALLIALPNTALSILVIAGAARER